MSDNLSSPPISSQGFYNPRVQVANTKNLNLVNAKNTQVNPDPFHPGEFTSEQSISKLAKALASRQGIPESVALRVVRKFISSGGLPNLKAMEDFVAKQINGEASKAAPASAKSNATQQLSNSEASKQTQQNASLKPLLKELKLNLNRGRNEEVRKEVENLFTRNSNQNLQQIPNSRIPVTTLVSSPKEFASWLVNNRTAFVALRTMPEVTNLLAAIQNPLLQQSPIVLAELSMLIAQILRLKLGKQAIDEIDDEERRQTVLSELAHREHERVGGVTGVAEPTEINPLKDFLLEAERFAEEEVANLWSLALKKEREFEKTLKAGIDSMTKKRK